MHKSSFKNVFNAVCKWCTTRCHCRVMCIYRIFICLVMVLYGIVPISFSFFIDILKHRSALIQWNHRDMGKRVSWMTLEVNYNTLQWRHNERHGISNHQLHDCLLNSLFRRRSKKASKLTGLCAGNSPVAGPVTRIVLPFDDAIMMIKIEGNRTKP